MVSRRCKDKVHLIDLSFCSDRELAWHLKSLLRVEQPLKVVHVEEICPENLVQILFDIAHAWQQPAQVKCHAVNLLEELVVRNGYLDHSTIPLVISLASKLHLTRTAVSPRKVQQFLRTTLNKEYTLKQLLAEEQLLLASLDFRVESNTMCQLVQTIMVIIERLDNKLGTLKLMDAASHTVCLYILYRREIPDRLRSFRKDSASAIILATKILADVKQAVDPRFVKALSTIMNLKAEKVVADAETLLKILIERYTKYPWQLPTNKSLGKALPTNLPCSSRK